MTTRDIIAKALQKTLAAHQAGEVLFTVERPDNPENGDYATNAALLSTKALKKPPMEIAETLAESLRRDATLKEQFDRIEVAKPGFINFCLSPKFLQSSVNEILKAKEKFGKGKSKESVNIEFISANPTGPLTLANGRGGFFGDVLGNILRFAGVKVDKEYYVNDAGNQIKTLGESVLAAGKLLEPAEHHYQGGYIASYAKEFSAELEQHVNEPEVLGKKVADAILARDIKPVIARAGIQFDIWTSEAKDIRGKGLVEKSMQQLEKKGYVYEKDGARWFKSSEFGDAEDRVLVKSVGNKDYTYIAVDIPNHLQKWKRGYGKLIDIWGADHHGDVARLQAGMKMLGKPEIKVILMQLVRLMEDGKEVRMSKRTGNFVTMVELLDEVGEDVARFFFLMREPNSHMDFDLTLAKEHSQKNPVFYVQYAYARLSNVLKKAKERGDRKAKRDLTLLKSQEELALIKKLLQFPELAEDIAKTHEVHRLPQYTMELATAFHKFYDTNRVIGEDRNVSLARVLLVETVKTVLGTTLKLMGVKAPEEM